MSINSKSCSHCYIDLDLDNHRSKLATAAAFVDATDSRYGFSSKDLRRLGGSEISRIADLMASDHEWSSKIANGGGGSSVEVRPPPAGNRIVVRLMWDVAPMACENFATLCTNGGTTLLQTASGGGGGSKKPKPAPVGESGKPLTYRGSTVHRIVPGFVMQGGDFVFGNGSGGESVFGGKKFKDEKSGLLLKHLPGRLSMGNNGKNSNSSQFFITFKEAPQCDGKHVVFGEVISGFEVLEAVEKVGTPGGEPTVPVAVTDCGAFTPFVTPGAGYWFDQPDADSYTGFSPVFMVKPRVAVFGPTRAVLERFQRAMVPHVVPVLIAVEDEENGQEALTKILTLLETFSIDVVVAAPACSDLLKNAELPSWAEQGPCGLERKLLFEDVIIIAKPVEAVSAVRNKSWAGKKTDWQLDGAML